MTDPKTERIEKKNCRRKCAGGGANAGGCACGAGAEKDGGSGGSGWMTVAKIAFSAAALAWSLFAPAPVVGGTAVDPAWIAVLLCGVPIAIEAVEALVRAFDVKADLLVAVALVAALASGEIFAAGEVAFIMALGEELEDWTVRRARRGIERLVSLSPRMARIVAQDGSERMVPADEVRAGNRVRVLPGETVPADGTVSDGHTALDQSAVTGEPMPEDKGPGDSVASGSVNRFGAFDFVASRDGTDGTLQRMIRLVQAADARKTRMVRLADRWATWIVAAAFATALAAWLATGEALRAVAVLVVFCPCSLVLATPTAVMAAIGNATKHGFLVREGDALERLAGVSRAAFDKTGTLTLAKPGVVAVESVGGVVSQGELLRLAGAAESRSEHPLGRAVAARAREEAGRLAEPESFEMVPGRGVRARVGGRAVAAGTAGFAGSSAESDEVARRWRERGCTVVHVAVDGSPAGVLALSDTLRGDAAESVAGVRSAGVEPVLLTGDNEGAAREAARSVGISEVKSACLPEDKLAWVVASEAHDRPVCMIGDGVNDAPALKAARVGIAVCGSGNDLAADAADIALVGGGMKGLPHLLRLARKTRRTIAAGLVFSMAVNFAAVALAAAGLLPPVAGALVHNAGSFLVVANSALLLHFKS